ncbi:MULTISPECIES: MurR/RpiR family transcriptional regulator [Symbiopectobacterium]|uniref:MurR/RpiR family transcriptional regulator n=1 Tax=Symbiopectobacterium TaxID=801 RepID=UPI001A30C9E6|nr:MULTISPECIES: MurR/RpiR family transcriptional regulator [Symbiopectobacterium]MBG6247824.1 MurR/RpiR family transcriptional regulator [Candidatus Symbiopectobacterium sp. PLON1]MBT9429372.1 MurR/RpiR family transcriptional regulator [Candidatus Symbiopectobacterium endolongispinus]
MQQDDANSANPDANVRIDLIARIEASFSQHTPSGKRVAGWLLNNLAQITFESADSIAGYTGTTGITVGRYLRKLGYRNLEDVKASLRADALAPYRHWGVTDRLDAWQQQRTLSNRLSPSLRLEVDAIQDVYRLAQTETFARISQQLAEAEAVFILGIQSTRGIANAFFSHLEYLRPRVSYVDGLSGTWVESLNSEYQRPYVVVTDTRAYSTVARQYCRAASDRQIPLALITDLWCHWARDYSMDLLQVKTDTGHFWDSLAPITYLFNLLLSAVVEQLGDKLSARLALNRALQTEFGQFEQ